ncbi:hypothetical protein [Haloferula sp. BvORR071]|uniref:hypothetical protein n=1 Tax=Haloferula sp. BvORR071 TaxID=1396141 RepID=UPI0005509668|nr:hypothetical protein [Haloferula sp. BvORR071]
MKIVRRLTFAALASLFASCTTYYKDPAGDSSNNAVLTSSTYDHFYNYECYIVKDVDGLPIDYYWVGPGKKKILLAPGEHQLTVKAAYSGGFQSAPFEVSETLRVLARPGRKYKATGKIESLRASIWIKDEASGEVVSEKKRADLQPAMQGAPPTLPIPPVMLR